MSNISLPPMLFLERSSVDLSEVPKRLYSRGSLHAFFTNVKLSLYCLQEESKLILASLPVLAKTKAGVLKANLY